ncbi:peptidoglycan DD-metalloendopeptidase family protein [Alkaliphilus peptidifermentans]|uniref:Murein DD-endopeptidase MepM and murein hydrolase activator NlpD, contain LysM domain n=1 Tax=Alkaliphilus peptidifermentans DSM 18978 TaxID=1120976 RepID=A0A1G5HDC5_9FIRM|nr:peptidoglycan DD-metalloendopeptidase family protein [Alkaliphilus peptidifermentans]SCY61766.1 Murein DD-endopeptidase MepM and murein hydrolase activator NlpD, contain LysM domain [Alkaliphilus peptidifermentans DSM 18978]
MNHRFMMLFQKKAKHMLKVFDYYSRIGVQRLRLYKNTKALQSFNRIDLKKNKQLIYIIGCIAMVVVLGGALLLNQVANSSLRAFEIELGGSSLAIVRSQEDFWDALEDAKEQVKQFYEQDVNFTDEIQVKRISADDEMITSHGDIIINIINRLDIKVNSVAIYVDGNEVIQLRDKRTAESVLQELKAPYVNEEENKYTSIDFKEKVELVEIFTKAGVIRSKEDAINYIVKGTDEEKTHEVQKGESTWSIALKYDLSVEDIATANPSINPDKLQIGQKISLIVPKPYISVVTMEYAELVETIAFDTDYESTDSLYTGDRKIIVQGTEGMREVKAYIIKENGVEVGREVLEEIILSEPKTRVIAEGTKPRPKTMATGNFSNPTRGKLSSGFGTRWGRRHEGIDISASSGTDIEAADGGKVSFAGWNGGYGNLVIIDHENGYQTYYAHCKTLLVEEGDRVYKGEKIATVGSTGNSTGPHLHFEVRKDGTPVNPLSFVSY